MVVVVGFATGFEMLAELKAVAGVHRYVFPTVAPAPIVVLLPLQIETFPPVVAVGKLFTVTVTEFDFLQPLKVLVSVRL